MKTAFLVTAYCNSVRKYDVLKGTLLALQDTAEHDVLLYSHSHINSDIMSLTDYCIYDYRNPIPPAHNRALIFWTLIQDDSRKIKLYTSNRDYGYTAISQIVNGSLFLKSIGYDAVFLLNYDLDYSQDLYTKTISEIRESDDFLLFEYNTPSLRHGLYLAWAYYKLTDRLIDRLSKVSINDYVIHTLNSDDIAENYMLDIFTESGEYKLIENELYLSENDAWRNRKFNIKTKVNHTADEFIPKENRYKTFSAYLSKLEGTLDYYLCLWDIEEDLIISLTVDGIDYEFEVLDRVGKIYTLPLPMITDNVVARNSINISINNTTIKQPQLSVANVCFFKDLE